MQNLLDIESYLSNLAKEYHLESNVVRQNLCEIVDELVTSEIKHENVKTVFENNELITICEYNGNQHIINYDQLPRSIIGKIVPNLKYRLKNLHFDEVQHRFHDQINQLFIGVVANIGDSIILEVDGARGLLPRYEQIPQENYAVGDEIACYLKEINNKSNERLIFSRKGEIFIELLLKHMVPSIQNDSIKIVKIARWNGIAAKVVIASNSYIHNCIGECLGERNVYYNEIVKHLQLEKIRFIEYKDDIYEYIANCLGYTNQIQDIIIDNDNKTVYVIISTEYPKGPIIGKNSINIRLTMRLQNKEKISKISILYPDEYQEILNKQQEEDNNQEDTEEEDNNQINKQ